MTEIYKGRVYGAEFVSAEDAEENEDKPAGVYLIVRLDDDAARIMAGAVTVRYEVQP